MGPFDVREWDVVMLGNGTFLTFDTGTFDVWERAPPVMCGIGTFLMFGNGTSVMFRYWDLSDVWECDLCDVW